MSTRFDDEVKASWARFEARVDEALAHIGEGSFSIDLEGETDETGAFPYVQFMGYDDRIRVEAAGNDVLDPAHRMQVDQENALVAVGWQRPAGGESPNWWFDVARDEVDLVLPMVTATFRQVFGVLHPRVLVSERLLPSDGGGDDDVEDQAHSSRALGGGVGAEALTGYPQGHDELVDLVSRTLEQLYGDDLVRDEDGDFAISTGTVPVWVRVRHDKPLVRIFSFVVSSVRDVRQARIEVGILNRRQDFLKFVLGDGLITATCDLPAAPFVGQQLLWMIDQVAEQLDDLAVDAAQRVGGKLWFDELGQSASDREESA
ncbi:MAG TPA: hypothetical protein VER39_08015 [Nocardioidaceae bacterium]|nr:hypothetical protein [Nocardioidaceae bacterium]